MPEISGITFDARATLEALVEAGQSGSQTLEVAVKLMRGARATAWSVSGCSRLMSKDMR